MSKDEAYMLPRDSSETERLEVQHQFLLALANGHLIHPIVPRRALQKIADVGTGTGVWPRELAKDQKENHPNAEFVGFDISKEQFPPVKSLSEEYVVHDMTKPFPNKYWEFFDLVNVRLLSYALKAHDLKQAVENVVQIIRPGGYLQWQEADFTDAWATPETEAARSVVSYVIAERMARGLTRWFLLTSLTSTLHSNFVPSKDRADTKIPYLSIVSPLVKEIQLLSTPIDPGLKNSIAWTNDLVRILRLETLSTATNPSPLIQAEGTNHTLTVAVVLLNAGATRRKKLATSSSVSVEESGRLIRDAEAMLALVRAIENGEDPAKSRWNGLLTLIVGRKAIVTAEAEPWMHVRHAMEAL